MLEIEKRIFGDISKYHGKVKLFWDMDGTCASMEMHMLQNKTDRGFFYCKRPIKTIINKMEKFQKSGAETYILSFCGYNYQKEDKMKWLQKYCKFIAPDNIIIIPRKENNVKKAESKQTLKAQYLRD